MVWGIAGWAFRKGTLGFSLFFAFFALSSLEARPKVLLVSSEVTPYFYSGGMGHMVSSLAHSLKRSGIDVHLAMPFYTSLPPSVVEASVLSPGKYETIYSGQASFQTRVFVEPKSGVPIHFFEHLADSPDRNFFENRASGRTYSTTTDHITLFDRLGAGGGDWMGGGSRSLENESGRSSFY